MKIARLTFPELHLSPRDAHKLRGYFGNLFQEHSPLLHNHLEGGGFRYAYPLVQYKVVGGLPVLLGLGEGAELLLELFLRIEELEIGERVYPLTNKDLKCEQAELSYSEELHTYAFRTLWMALNQENYARYVKASEGERQLHLSALLRGHLLAVFKGGGIWLAPEQRIVAKPEVRQKTVQFKGQQMLAFDGRFMANVLLPKWIGVGKSVSRGFGTVERLRD